MALADPNASGSSVTNPRSRPALTTDSVTDCTLSASTLRYSSSRTDARNMKLPQITGLDIFGGRCRIRLLDELRDGTDLAGNDFARADIAVLGGRTLGRNAEGHDASRIGSYQDRKSTRLNSSHRC